MQQNNGLPWALVVFCLSRPVRKSPRNTHGGSRCAVGCVLARKPVTKLAQHCAGVAYLWLGYPGRSSGSGQPDSPPQSPELPYDRWARGATSNQQGHRRGGGRLQRYQQVCQSLATGGGSPPRHSCGLTASEPAARPRPQLLFFWLRRNKKQCRGADFGAWGGTSAPWLPTKKLCRHLG